MSRKKGGVETLAEVGNRYAKGVRGKGAAWKRGVQGGGERWCTKIGKITGTGTCNSTSQEAYNTKVGAVSGESWESAAVSAKGKMQSNWAAKVSGTGHKRRAKSAAMEEE